MEKTDTGTAKVSNRSDSVTAKPLAPDGRLSWVTRIAYGSGDAACNVCLLYTSSSGRNSSALDVVPSG